MVKRFSKNLFRKCFDCVVLQIKKVLVAWSKGEAKEMKVMAKPDWKKKEDGEHVPSRTWNGKVAYVDTLIEFIASPECVGCKEGTCRNCTYIELSQIE